MNLPATVISTLSGLFLEEKKKERKYLVGLYRHVCNEKGRMTKPKLNPEHFSLKSKALTTELNPLPSAMFIVLSILYVYTHDITIFLTQSHIYTLLLPNFPGMIDFEISNQICYQ